MAFKNFFNYFAKKPDMMNQAAESRKLYSFEFVSLCFVSFFAFCNISVFYSFFSYLGQIGIPEGWRGLLLGIEPMTAFALRLAIIPLLHLGNAAGAMLVGLVMIVAALWSYTWALTIPALIAVRIFHGAAFVLAVSATVALAVHFIPKQSSARGFGVLSIMTLVPFAVMPLVTEALMPFVTSTASIYAGVTVLAVPGIIILPILRHRVRALGIDPKTSLMRRPSLKELGNNLKHRPVVLLLAVNLLIYLCYATVFFFVKGYLKVTGGGEAGAFFTISTLMMIAVRAGGGQLWDKVDKVKTMTLCMFFLAPWFVVFGLAHTTLTFSVLSASYGLCLGIVMPLLSAAMFLASPEQLRGLNINLSLFMMDAGYFLSPIAGGMLLAGGWPFQTLFYGCAGLLILAVGLLVALGWQGLEPPAAETAAGPQ